MSDQYTIQQYCFAIGFHDQSKVHELHNLFSRLFYNQAMPVMEKVFEELVPANRVVKGNMVEVDLGSIPYERLEKDFARRLKEALEKELSILLTRNEATGTIQDRTGETDSLNGSMIAWLEYFLMTGSLPWWASRQIAANPVEVMEQLIMEAPANVRDMLLRVGEHADARRRIVYQFPGSVTRSVIQMVEPAQAEFIVSHHTHIVQVQQQQKIINGELREVEKAAWIFIFDFLLTEHGNYFNRKAFVRYTLRQMGRHFNLPYEQVLTLFTSALHHLQLQGQPVDALPAIIHELAHEQPDASQQPSLPGTITTANDQWETPENIQQHLELIRYYWLFGSLPAWAMSADSRQLLQLFLQVIEQVPATVKAMVATLAQQEPVRARMAAMLDDTAMHKVVRLEEPAEADFIIRYVEGLQIQQHKRSLVKVEGSAFRQTIWQFILAYLYTEKGSVFNSRMFVKGHIQRMAQHYRMRYGQMLMFLVQGMGEDMQAAEDSSLFHLLAELLHEYNTASNGIEMNGHAALPVAQVQHNAEKDNLPVVLRDILAYWIMHDRYPWWNQTYTNRSPESLWYQLLQAAPGYAKELLQLAGEQEVTAHRLVHHLLPAALLPVFQLMDHGYLPEQAYMNMITVLELTMPGRVLTRQQVQAELLLQAWQSWQAGYYTTLDNKLLIIKSIAKLARLMEITADALLEAVTMSFERQTPTGLPLVFMEAWRSIQKERNTLQQLHVARYWPEGAITIDEMIEAGDANSKKLLDVALAYIKEQAIQQWLRTHLQSPAVARFITNNYPAENTGLLMQQLYPWQAKEAIPLVQKVEILLTLLITDTLERDRLQLLLREFTLHFLATGQSIQSYDFFFAQWFRLVALRRPILVNLLSTALKDKDGNDHGISENRFPFLQAFRLPFENKVNQSLVQDALYDDEKQAEEVLQRITREMAAKKQQSIDDRKQQAKKRLNADSSPLYVHNAGLVLLHPLFNTLFTRLQLMENGNFIQEAAQHRAIHLLQFLVYGQEQWPEYELPLNKLLCGWPLEEPIPAGIILTTEEKQTGEELLKVVLQRWDKLKNTSVEGLRVSFLRREGALTLANDHYNLRVEQRGIDVLLSFLPWGFGMIKASWMKKTLFTEWI